MHTVANVLVFSVRRLLEREEDFEQKEVLQGPRAGRLSAVRSTMFYFGADMPTKLY